MIPHEKALVERMKNEPFALIGVNTDPDKAEYKRQAAANGVTWRSAWDGSTRGPLCTAWGITSFPTIYVIDAKGTIRHAGLRGRDLDAAVDALIAEAKASPPPAPKPAETPKAPAYDGASDGASDGATGRADDGASGRAPRGDANAPHPPS